jgi:hypothetical protein
VVWGSDADDHTLVSSVVARRVKRHPHRHGQWQRAYGSSPITVVTSTNRPRPVPLAQVFNAAGSRGLNVNGALGSECPAKDRETLPAFFAYPPKH